MSAPTQTGFATGIKLLGYVLLMCTLTAHAADYPAPVEGDFILRDFHFSNGETRPELRIHYRTLGKPQKDENGIVRNAVLIGHGTGGTGAQFIRPELAGELFGAGQLARCDPLFHPHPRRHWPR